MKYANNNLMRSRSSHSFNIQNAVTFNEKYLAKVGQILKKSKPEKSATVKVINSTSRIGKGKNNRAIDNSNNVNPKLKNTITVQRYSVKKPSNKQDVENIVNKKSSKEKENAKLNIQKKGDRGDTKPAVKKTIRKTKKTKFKKKPASPEGIKRITIKKITANIEPNNTEVKNTETDNTKVKTTEPKRQPSTIKHESTEKILKPKINKPKITEITVKDRNVKIVPFRGVKVSKEDAKRIKSLRRDLMSKGTPEPELQNILRAERKRASRTLSRMLTSKMQPEKAKEKTKRRIAKKKSKKKEEKKEVVVDDIRPLEHRVNKIIKFDD